MNSRSFKSRLLATSIIAGTALSSLALPVASQEEEEEEAVQATVLVTGSRIKKRDFFSNSPIETITAETIEVTGTINVEELINIMPQAVPGFGRASNNPGSGTATVNLRGLGSGRTLVLVDGRRFTPTGISTVDLNNIPPNLIENVEIITGGASAVYGSDAMAGVVNFILKDDFQGLEIRSGYEATVSQGDAEYYNIGFTFGAMLDGGRGSVMFDMGHTDRKPVFQRDRAFSLHAMIDSGDTLVRGGSAGVPAGHSWGNFDFSALGTSVLTPASGDTPASCSQPGTAPRSRGDIATAKFGPLTYCTGQAIFAGTEGFRPWINGGPNNDRFNYAPFNYLQLPQERFNFYSKAQYSVNDSLSVFAQVTAAFNQVPTELAPTPAFTSVATHVSNPLVSERGRQAFVLLDRLEARSAYELAWNAVYRTALAAEKRENPNSDLNLPSTTDTNKARIKAAELAFISQFRADPNNGVPDRAEERFQPDGIVTQFIGRRMIENGSREEYNDFFLFQYTNGIKGSFNDNVEYEAYFQFGRSQNSRDLAGDVSVARFKAGVLVTADDNGDPVCVVGGDCVPIDIWGEGDVSKPAIDYMTLSLNSKTESNLNVLVGNISGNTDGIFALQGGPIGWAVGLEYREQSYDFRPDDSLRTANVLGFNSQRPLAGGFDVYEVYAEVNLPIARGRPWAELVELDLGFRLSEYSSIGNVEAFKLGGAWAPSKDLRFRMLYNNAVRAPVIGELFSERSNSFPGATDPCDADALATYESRDGFSEDRIDDIKELCTETGVPNIDNYKQANAQIESIVGGNPNLISEEADTITVGFVWQPTNIDGLNIALDYYDIDISKYITLLAGGTQGILYQCYLYNPTYDPNSIFCKVIERRSTGQPIVTSLAANTGSLRNSGIDLSIDYLFEIDSLPGTFQIDYVANYLDRYEFTAFQGDETKRWAGTFGNESGEPKPTFKHGFTGSWINDGFSIHLNWTHISSVDDTESSVVDTLDAYSLFDLGVALDLSESVKLTGGVKNLMDQEPQLLGDNQQQANTWPSTYDVFGRTFYLSTKFSF